MTGNHVAPTPKTLTNGRGAQAARVMLMISRLRRDLGTLERTDVPTKEQLDRLEADANELEAALQHRAVLPLSAVAIQRGLGLASLSRGYVSCERSRVRFLRAFEYGYPLLIGGVVPLLVCLIIGNYPVFAPWRDEILRSPWFLSPVGVACAAAVMGGRKDVTTVTEERERNV